MKRISMLLALVAILALTAWLGDARPAYAMPNCSDLRGQACSTLGQQFNCWTQSGGIGVCRCMAFPGEPQEWFCTG